VFESCRGGSSGKVLKTLKKISTGKSTEKIVKPPVNLLGIIETEGARIARITRGDFKSITEVAEHFKFNGIKSGKVEFVEFQDYSMSEVKAIITKNSINEVRTLSNVKQIFNSAFKELNYSKAEYFYIENNLIMVTIPYYTRLGYLKSLNSYVTFKINEGNLSKIKNIISKLSRDEVSPYTKFENELKSANISITDKRIVHYIENGEIAENYLDKKSNERYNISPDAA
jgi:hypothetical protein